MDSASRPTAGKGLQDEKRALFGMEDTMKNRFRLAAAAALAAGLVAGSAMAQPRQLEPTSLQIFPLYVSEDGTGTLVSVTNINDDRTFCPDEDFRGGDVVVHYVYIDGRTWREFDRFEPLTPGDTLSVIVAEHNPDSGFGFLVTRALDPVTLEAIDFDYLIGSAIVVESNLNFMWQYTPYGFRGNADDDTQEGCSRVLVDDDGDGAADFDGVEYDFFPAELFVASFFEERGAFGNEIALLSTAGQDFINDVRLLIWNNNEQKFSRTIKFVCFEKKALSELSRVATRLGGRSGELQTGWVSIKGVRVVDRSGNPVPNSSNGVTVPPLLGVFMQMIRNSQFSVGHALHFRGALDGLELLGGDGDPQDPNSV
jgi:hypothetical protein